MANAPAAENRPAVEAKIAELEASADKIAKQNNDQARATEPPAGDSRDMQGETIVPGEPLGLARPLPAEPESASGDPELDRVAAVNLNQIRDERRRAGLVPTPSAADVGAAQGMGSVPSGQPPAAPGTAPEHGKADKPFYTEWWFWVVAGAGTLVLISFATADAKSNSNQPLWLPPMRNQSIGAASGGLQWRF